MDAIMLIIVVAVTVEALVQYGKTLIAMFTQDDLKTAITQLGAMFAAILICAACGANLYTIVGVNFAYPWVGVILTGIFTSRGANYTSDLLKRLKQPIGDLIVEGIPETADSK